MISSLLYVFDMITSKKKRLSATGRQTAIKTGTRDREQTESRHKLIFLNFGCNCNETNH